MWKAQAVAKECPAWALQLARECFLMPVQGQERFWEGAPTPPWHLVEFMGAARGEECVWSTPRARRQTLGLSQVPS